MVTILRSLDHNTLNKSMILPVVGVVTFNDKNEIEVDEDKANTLLSRNCGIQLIVTMTPEKIEEAKKALENLKMEDLKELVKDYPEKDVKKLSTKNSIVQYLKKQFNA